VWWWSKSIEVMIDDAIETCIGRGTLNCLIFSICVKRFVASRSEAEISANCYCGKYSTNLLLNAVLDMKITSRTALLLYLHSALHFKSASTVSEVRIGGSFPLLLSDGSVDPYGPQYLAAFLMAIEDVENKTDGLWDNLLPNVSIKYAIRGSPGPFIDDCSAGVDFARRVFNKQGVHGVIGGANDVASRALGQVFKYPKMVQVAYGSQGFDLSYSFPYPYYFRTTVDDLFYGTAMADIIVNHFGWKKISIFAITDFYSGSATAQLENIVTSKGIEVISTHEFGSGTEDLSKPIQEAKSYGSRIFMFYGLKPTDVRRLLRQGYEKGLFYEGTQIVGDANTVSADIWTNESQPSSSNLSRDPEIMRIMSGVIGIKLLSSFNGDLGERFISKWKKQRNTFSYADDGVTQECKIAMDSDGGTELYRANNTDSDGKVTTVCTGVTFTQFLKDDGSDIAPLASITYDATIALLKGLHTVIYDYGVTDDSKVGDGDVLGAAVQNVSFSGVSGDVKFRLGDPQTGFGFGDREVGQTFQVLNFHPVLYSLTRGQIAFQQIGTWTLEAGFTVGEWDLPPLFNTKNNALPLDSPEPVPVRMSASLRGLLIAFAVLGILTTVFFAGVVIWKRHSRMIRASQPLMLAALLAGALVSCARVIAGSYDLTDEVCVAQTWTGHLAFGLICGALITKTWRVHMIINTTMKRVKITTNHVLIMIAAITALLAIYLTIFTVVGKPHVVLTVRDDGQLATSHLFSCQDSNGTFAIVLYVLEAVSLAYGVRLCMATKNAPGAVNESGAFGLGKQNGIFI
jgi:ABC-type branched-subunit amino acid transport system substrate-binding protein